MATLSDMTMATQVTPEVAAELDAIDTAREAAFGMLREANRAGWIGPSALATVEAFAAVDERVEALHRKAWPRHHGTLVVALGGAALVSPTGRTRSVWQRGR